MSKRELWVTEAMTKFGWLPQSGGADPIKRRAEEAWAQQELEDAGIETRVVRYVPAEEVERLEQARRLLKQVIAESVINSTGAVRRERISELTADWCDRELGGKGGDG